MLILSIQDLRLDWIHSQHLLSKEASCSTSNKGELCFLMSPTTSWNVNKIPLWRSWAKGWLVVSHAWRSLRSVAYRTSLLGTNKQTQSSLFSRQSSLLEAYHQRGVRLKPSGCEGHLFFDGSPRSRSHLRIHHLVWKWCQVSGCPPLFSALFFLGRLAWDSVAPPSLWIIDLLPEERGSWGFQWQRGRWNLQVLFNPSKRENEKAQSYAQGHLRDCFVVCSTSAPVETPTVQAWLNNESVFWLANCTAL